MNLFGRLIPAWVWFAVIGGLLALVGVQQLRIGALKTSHAEYVAKVAEEETGRANAALEATKETQRIAARWNAQQLGALNAARTRETVLAAAAGRARTELGRLRDATKAAAGRRVLPGATGAPSDHYADTVGELFLECAATFVGLADSAGGHASDVQTLSDSWPKAEKEKQ